MKTYKFIKVRLTESEYDRLTTLVGEASISAYVKRLIAGDAERVKKEGVDSSVLLRAIEDIRSALKQAGEQNGIERVEKGIRELKTITTVIALVNPIASKRLRGLFPKLTAEVDAL